MNSPIPLRPSFADAERLERQSFVRAVTAQALAVQRSDPAKILRGAWPNDARAMSVLKSATSQTTTGDFPKADAIAAFRDLVAFDSAAGDAVRPPGLLHNTVPLTPTAAGSDAMAEDLAALVAEIASFGIDASNVVYVASPREAALIAFRAGPNFTSRVLMSAALAPKTVAAFAPSGVFCAYDGTPTVEVVKEALIHFEDTTPANISDGTGVAAPTKSAFQTDLLALKIRAECSWVAVPGAAQSIVGVSW